VLLSTEDEGPAPGGRLTVGRSDVEGGAGVGALVAMVRSSWRSSFRTTWKVGKDTVLLMRAFRWL
jgi:hypothetical protein